MATEIYRQKVNDLNARAKRAGAKGRLNAADLYAVLEYCGNHCQMPGCTNTDVTFDHVEPLEHGGLNARSNLGLLCESHNKGKSDNIVPDYREGRICPDDYVATNVPEKEPQTKRRNKVDWNAVRLQYVTGNMSLRELAEIEEIPFPTLRYQSVEIDDWNKQREEFRNKVVTLSEQAMAEKEVKARALTFDVGVEIVQDWRRNIKRSTNAAEVVSILKVLLALQGNPTDRIEHVDAEQSEAAVLARINSAFDTGEEETSYTRLGDFGEDSGAGWSD